MAGKACHVVGSATQVGLTQALGLTTDAAMKKFTDIMFDDLTAEQLRELPDGWGAAWLMRPKRDAIDHAKLAMYVRSALIAGSALYFYSRPGGGAQGGLVLILAMYEFAYYSLRKDKCERDYNLQKELYVARARELDSEA